MEIDKVKRKLRNMVEEDQAVRESIDFENFTKEDKKRLKGVDNKNLKKIKKIVNEHGLITISKFGKEACKNAWLIVQHMVMDLNFMESYLNMMEENLNDVIKKNYAYLKDRVLVYKNKKQIYGTQFYYNEEREKIVPRPIRDKKKVNDRREKVGIEEILEEYAKAFNK